MRNRLLPTLLVAVIATAVALSVEHIFFIPPSTRAADTNPTVMYKVVQIHSGPDFAQDAEAKLNQMAGQGWEYNSDILGALVFKRHP